MITGRVHLHEAIIPIRPRGASGNLVAIESVLDTGFSDWITLPPHIVASLGLIFREEGRYVLADGSISRTRLFEAEIDWFGNWKLILVLENEGGSLLGMEMIARCNLNLDAVENGAVEIRPLK